MSLLQVGRGEITALVVAEVLVSAERAIADIDVSLIGEVEPRTGSVPTSHRAASRADQ